MWSIHIAMLSLLVILFENGFLNKMRKIIAFTLKWCLMMLKMVLLSEYMLDMPKVVNFYDL
jgi:hypothetical protein